MSQPARFAVGSRGYCLRRSRVTAGASCGSGRGTVVAAELGVNVLLDTDTRMLAGR